MTFLAFHLYKETWEIEEQNRIITIRKNGKVRFQGRRIDITSVSSDWTDYLVSPAKGRTMRIPKKAANDTLLKLIGKVDQPRT